MSEKKPDWRSTLHSVVDDRRREMGPHPDLDALVAYHGGELPPAETERLRNHLVVCPECARLLLDLDAFAADAARVPSEATPAPSPAPPAPAPVVPLAARRAARWRRWAPAAAAAVAAAVLLLVWSRGEPLPAYAPPSLAGALQPTRSAESDPGEEVPVFAPGHRLTLVLRPTTAVDGPVTARAYLRRGDELRTLSASTLEVSGDGVVSLDGIVGTEILLPSGDGALILVVARPDALPSRHRLLDELERGSPALGKGWIAYEKRIRVLEPVARKPPALPEEEPWIEHAGCRAVLAGPVCRLPDDRRLTLWVRRHPGDELRIEAGDRTRASPAVELRGGTRHEVVVGGEARELVVELRSGEERWIWTLELETAPTPGWLAEARELYERGEWDAARRRLEPPASGADLSAAGPARGLLARIERRSGRAEFGDRLYRRAIAAHRDAGHLSEEIRDAAGFTFHLVQEKRFTEARELLAGLPVDATGGAAEAWSSVAYLRGLLAEETGDLRAALAWTARAGRAAERAGLTRKRLLAQDLLARQLDTVGLAEAAAELRARMEPRMAELCGGDGRASVLDACDCANFEVNRAWTALLALEAGRRPGPDVDPAALLENAERIFTAEAARGEGSCLLPEDLPNLRLNRALAALHRDDPAAARRHLERAGVDPEDLPRLALWQLDVEARIRLAEGQPGPALDLYDRLARRAELASSPEAAWRAAFGRAAALGSLGRSGDAVDACNRAEELLDRESLLVPMHAGRALFIAQRQRAAGFCLDLLLRTGRGDGALAVARRSAARALRNLRVGARIAGLGDADRERWERAAAAYRRSADAIEKRAAAVWRGLPRDREERLEAEIAAERRRLRQELDRMSALLGDSSALAGRDPPPPPPGTLLLVYHPLPRGWAALAADGERTIARRLDPAGELPLEARPEAELSSHLLEPFAAEIRRAAEIQVISYGALRNVDFHALPFDGGVLLDRAPVVYRLDLPALPAEPPAPPRALIVAGPGLLAAPSEARAVRGALESRPGPWRVELLEGPAASRRAVLERLRGATLFHYAGHAEFDPESRGWDSHLALASGGRLTVDDLLASPPGPRWAVLSGCDTARDSPAAPLPNVGLAQALLVAGTEAVVAATAELSDAGAAGLTAALYRHWDRSGSLAAALRAAQLERRELDPGSDWRKLRVLAR